MCASSSQSPQFIDENEFDCCLRYKTFLNCPIQISLAFNPLGHIKTAEQGTIIQQYTVIGALAVDGWAVSLTFGTTRRGPGGLRSCAVPSSLYQM